MIENIVVVVVLVDVVAVARFPEVVTLAEPAGQLTVTMPEDPVVY
jgi:hypothetical protein